MSKTQALRRAARAKSAREKASKAYAQALQDAHDAGASWPEIARAVGDKSPASVYRFARRHAPD